MAKRILLQAHKDPFAVASPRRVLQRNLIGDNLGNLLTSNAAYKLLDTRDTAIATDPLRELAGRPGRVQASFDHLVLPLANAFRLSYQGSLDRLSTLVEQTDVPVTVLGVGAQVDLAGSAKALEPIRGSVQRFVAAVLDRSPSIGVWGESTERYLRGLGFRDVEVIGRPSMFLRGPDLRVVKRARRLTRSSRISLNLTPSVPGLGGLVEAHTQRYPRLHYTAQSRDALGMLLAHRTGSRAYAGPGTRLPDTLAHPLVAEGRSSMFTDPQPWLGHLAEFDFSFGTRVDGNIAALLAGTPAYLLAGDGSTLEVARHFGIPHRTMWRVTDRTDAAALYEEADYDGFNRTLPEHFGRLAGFLAAHNLRHVYEEGEDSHLFDAHTAATSYPGAITRAMPSTPMRAVRQLVRSAIARPQRPTLTIQLPASPTRTVQPPAVLAPPTPAAERAQQPAA